MAIMIGSKFDDPWPYAISMHIPSWWKSTDNYSSYCPEMKIRTDRCTYDKWMDGQTNFDQRETIIFRYYFNNSKTLHQPSNNLVDLEHFAILQVSGLLTFAEIKLYLMIWFGFWQWKWRLCLLGLNTQELIFYKQLFDVIICHRIALFF